MIAHAANRRLLSRSAIAVLACLLTLVPLAHADVEMAVEAEGIRIFASAATVGPTGVEMEALTACSVAALTIYDMCKSVDRSMVIGDVALWEKTGGRSGTYRRGPLEDDLDLGL